MLDGLKHSLLTDEMIASFERDVATLLRERTDAVRPDSKVLEKRQRELGKEIDNLTQAIRSIGFSQSLAEHPMCWENLYRLAGKQEPVKSLIMVAGAGFEPATFGL